MTTRQNETAGFTLIELLIVVVIIGILAGIAIPKFANTKEKAHMATMKSDLRNLATAQEGHLYDNQTYYDGPVPGAGLDFQLSTGVSIVLSDVSTSGWVGTAEHTGVSSRTCVLFIGSAAPVAPATQEGQVACD